MEHTMWLDDEPFSKILTREKTIELRLNDEKRQKIQVGDIIFFKNRKTQRQIAVTCKKLHFAKSFKELFEHHSDHAAFGLESQNDTEAMVGDMRKYYSGSDEIAYGVVGIEFYGPTNCMREYELLIEKLFADDYFAIRRQVDIYEVPANISIFRIFDKIIATAYERHYSSWYIEEHKEFQKYFKMVYYYAEKHNYQDICRMLSDITLVEFSKAGYYNKEHRLKHLSHVKYLPIAGKDRYSIDEIPLHWREFYNNFSILKYMCYLYDLRIDEPWYYMSGME